MTKKNKTEPDDPTHNNPNARHFKLRLAALGTFRDDGIDLELSAPSGKTWRATGDHVLVEHPENETERNGALRQLLENAEMGTDPCEDATCEVCGPASPIERGQR